MPQFFVMLFVSIISLYLAGCGLLFVAQRSLIYYPQPSAMIKRENTLKLAVADAELQVTIRPLKTANAVIYFGGNAEDVAKNLPDFSGIFPKHALYLMHYRGYGQSSGSPSEQALVQDGLALFDKVVAEHEQVVIIGRSLGSGVAIQVASLRPAAKLVLITPFDSLQAVAAYHYSYMPVRWLLQDKYESWRYAPKIKVPTLIIGAKQDEVIPLAHAKTLYTYFNKDIAVFKVLSTSNHNTLSEDPEYFLLLNTFVNF